MAVLECSNVFMASFFTNDRIASAVFLKRFSVFFAPYLPDGSDRPAADTRPDPLGDVFPTTLGTAPDPRVLMAPHAFGVKFLKKDAMDPLNFLPNATVCRAVRLKLSANL
jgi:hypothetical protein